MVMFLVRHPLMFIFLSLFDLFECLVMLMTLILVIRFRQQNYVGLKTHLLEGLSEPEFFGTWCINSENKMVKMIFLIISKR